MVIKLANEMTGMAKVTMVTNEIPGYGPGNQCKAEVFAKRTMKQQGTRNFL